MLLKKRRDKTTLHHTCLVQGRATLVDFTFRVEWSDGRRFLSQHHEIRPRCGRHREADTDQKLLSQTCACQLKGCFAMQSIDCK